MSVIYVLLPVAVLMAMAFVALFVWATRTGQFDDVSTPPLRVLFDEEGANGAEKPEPATDGKDRT
jgi:cbb3-type cytochrome oxidase maturation protein